MKDTPEHFEIPAFKGLKSQNFREKPKKSVFSVSNTERGAKSHSRSEDEEQGAEFRSQELNSLPGNTSEEVDDDADAEEIALRPRNRSYRLL